ncbi:MAG: LD-carboxypeptidase [Chryseolinea sp.]
MITPPRLSSGDTIGIVASGKRVSAENLEAAILQLQSWGLKVVVGDNVIRNEHSYLAASDLNRKSDFQAMLKNKDVKAILCARGGYGSTRIVDDIDFTPLQQDPKWIIGFSDVTAIHMKLLPAGIQSIHGPMALNFSNPLSQSSIEKLKHLLFDSPYTLEAPGSTSNRTGEADGIITGGNLSLIVESLGTSSENDFDGCILIIEEIDEFYYRLDRMFMQLKRAGKLSNISGLIIGQMTSMKEEDPEFGESVEQIVLDKVKGYKYPVAFNFPIGHEQPNLPWINGSTMRLNVGLHKSVLQPLS